jgi:AraC-like DNA-binding protein
MIRIEAQNKYVGGGRESEACFLDMTSCVKKRFFKDSESKVTPSDKYELFCVICGEVYLPDAKKTIRKNGIILIRNFSKAKLEIKESSEIVHIVFSASHTLPILTDCTGQMFFEGFASFSLIDKLHRISCKKNGISGIKEALLLELLCDMNDYRNATRAELALYRQACDWIEKNAERAITSQEVAIAIGCSRAYLNRVVKAACGECLSDVIAQYRLERIKNFCDSGGLSVSEIAHRLGFYSTELLCKFFKYHEGVSINKYKNSTKM